MSKWSRQGIYLHQPSSSWTQTECSGSVLRLFHGAVPSVLPTVGTFASPSNKAPHQSDRHTGTVCVCACVCVCVCVCVCMCDEGEGSVKLMPPVAVYLLVGCGGYCCGGYGGGVCRCEGCEGGGEEEVSSRSRSSSVRTLPLTGTLGELLSCGGVKG